MKEMFHPTTIVDSCRNQTVTPTSCRQNYAGQPESKFTDITGVGCATVGDPHTCGYIIDPNDFAWCTPIGITYLARVYKDVRYLVININGSTQPWTRYSEFYP